jgi:uncharacterized protein
MRKKIQVIVIGFFCITSALFGQCEMKTDTLSFVSDGKRLHGLLDVPIGQTPASIVLIIQGSGKSNIDDNGYYKNIRSHLVQSGLACYIWDKPGCGKSEGIFDGDQSVKNAAKEAIAAISELVNRKAQGIEIIGLWGISRAGWICPLIIQQYPSISYWISVSGTDDKENFGYLLESNFRIEGRNEKQTQLLISEWSNGNDIFRKGGSFEEYQEATQNLRQDTFWLSVSGDQYTKEGYLRIQKNFINEHHEFDEETGVISQILIEFLSLIRSKPL